MRRIVQGQVECHAIRIPYILSRSGPVACACTGQLRVKSRDDGEMFLFYVLDETGLDRGPIYEHY